MNAVFLLPRKSFGDNNVSNTVTRRKEQLKSTLQCNQFVLRHLLMGTFAHTKKAHENRCPDLTYITEITQGKRVDTTEIHSPLILASTSS
ncbi:hypothetical protein Y032_0035g3119 [Ancylostoma ceylanicum]|nr:hypothetical protein Y032_0035g3119 [Ancylostoma ceylanicum]